MLDLRFIREKPEIVKKAIKDRNLKEPDIDSLLKNDNERRKIDTQIETKYAERNKANDEIGALKKEKKDAKEKIASMKKTAIEIDKLEKQRKEKQEILVKMLYEVPNIPHSSIPVGGASKSKIVRSWGKPRDFDFTPLSHIELAGALDIIDFATAAKLTGSNFALYKGWGAKLERALINFMLDLHTNKHGYKEIAPPFLVNSKSMEGTGQLPKLEKDMYRIEDKGYFLVPTAEVPLTNMLRDVVLTEEELPVYYTAYTACFRKEAGSYGKDTKGLVRIHQFDKVELVKFVKAEHSYEELEKLVKDAEEVLQLLEIPYRVVMLPTHDLSFAASKCYDLEAYAPGIDKWLEVSSCSNFESFQSRRINIRYRSKDKKLQYLHTLNGSGVALARTLIAILETYQQKDGSIIVPAVLRPYLNEKDRIG